jgi:hypothetical protein
MQIISSFDADNHRGISHFMWWDEPKDSDLRALVYTDTRDSCLLERTNARAIEETMKPFVEDGSALREYHNHWTCGWIDGYTILVDDPIWGLTPAALAWNNLAEKYMDYPILDENVYDQAVCDAINALSLYDLQCLVEDHLDVSDASEMTEQEIRDLPDFWDHALEWVES